MMHWTLSSRRRALVAGLTASLVVGHVGPRTIVTAEAPQGATAQTDAATQAAKDFDETVRRGDALAASGNFFDAVLAFERASRVAYNNKLKIDAAALQAKLAAARAGRDAAKAVSQPPPPPPSAPAAVQSAQSSQGETGAASTVVAQKEYDDAVKLADAFAAAGDYVEAIKEYERAARVAYNNKLQTDSAALESKRSKAQAAQRVTAAAPREMLPPPPPPIPGQSSGPKRLPDTPGKIRPWRFPTPSAYADINPKFRPSPAEVKAFEANVLRVVDVIKSEPMLNPPMGFELDLHGWLYSPEDAAPLTGYVSFGAFGYFEERVRVKATGEIKSRPVTGDETTGVDVEINRLEVNNLGAMRWEDNQGQMFFDPFKLGEIAGYPVYGPGRLSAGNLFILRPGVDLFVPVRMDRFAKQWVVDRKKWADVAESVLASKRKEAEVVLSQEKRDSRRREIEAERAKGGAGVEQNVRRLEVIAKRVEDDARKVLDSGEQDPKYRKPLQAYRDAQALAASLSPASAAGVPCFLNAENSNDPAGDNLTLVPAGTPGCRRVVSYNPALVKPGVPRTAIQWLSVPSVTTCSEELRRGTTSRDDVGGCLAAVRMLRALDWKRLAGLIEP
jgi:tetratricopeptide (TPR) repeat protein